MQGGGRRRRRARARLFSALPTAVTPFFLYFYGERAISEPIGAHKTIAAQVRSEVRGGRGTRSPGGGGAPASRGRFNDFFATIIIFFVVYMRNPAAPLPRSIRGAGSLLNAGAQVGYVARAHNCAWK